MNYVYQTIDLVLNELNTNSFMDKDIVITVITTTLYIYVFLYKFSNSYILYILLKWMFIIYQEKFSRFCLLGYNYQFLIPSCWFCLIGNNSIQSVSWHISWIQLVCNLVDF